MIAQGEIYWYTDPDIGLHHVVVLSREEFNRGDRVVAAVITSTKFSLRSSLPNCVPLWAGQWGLTKDCVIQGESIFNAKVANLDLGAGPLGKLDGRRIREAIKALGFILDADCEPN